MAIVEQVISSHGHLIPKLVVFYRDGSGELHSIVTNAAKIGWSEETGKKFKVLKDDLKVKSVDFLVSYCDVYVSESENFISEKGLNSEPKDVLKKEGILVCGYDMKDKTQVLSLKEVQRYMLPDKPELPMFTLAEWQENKTYKFDSLIINGFLKTYIQK